MSGSVLIHVQHLLGIGHLQRARYVAEALARAGCAVTLVSGGMPVPALSANGIRVVQLPPIRSVDAHFDLVDAEGRPLDDALRAARREAVLAAFAGAAPDVVVVEGFPFARRALRFELDPLIAAARQAGARLVCSVRDVVQPRDNPARQREIVARVRAEFDTVLVHGDPTLIRFEASFPAAAEIADRLVYTGYVTERDPREQAPEASGAAEVLVSGGGGPAGLALLQTAIAARRLGCLPERPWRLLAGGGLAEAQFAAMAASVPRGVTLERFRPDFPALLARCHVSVSQAGYNTVLDVLAARKRAVLVPFAAEREREQLIRAERVAALGATELLRETELTPRALADAIERAAAAVPVPVDIDMTGAETSARLIAAMIEADATLRGGSAPPRLGSIIL